MNHTEIAQIAARVLYLDSADQIAVSDCLFQDHGMSWLEFVDFACELQAATHKTFDPDQLWPINAMRHQAELYRCGDWTDAGRAELARIFDGHPAQPAGAAREPHGLFTVAYVEHRLRAL